MTLPHAHGSLGREAQAGPRPAVREAEPRVPSAAGMGGGGRERVERRRLGPGRTRRRPEPGRRVTLGGAGLALSPSQKPRPARAPVRGEERGFFACSSCCRPRLGPDPGWPSRACPGLWPGRRRPLLPGPAPAGRALTVIAAGPPCRGQALYGMTPPTSQTNLASRRYARRWPPSRGLGFPAPIAAARPSGRPNPGAWAFWARRPAGPRHLPRWSLNVPAGQAARSPPAPTARGGGPVGIWAPAPSHLRRHIPQLRPRAGAPEIGPTRRRPAGASRASASGRAAPAFAPPAVGAGGGGGRCVGVSGGNERGRGAPCLCPLKEALLIKTTVGT